MLMLILDCCSCFCFQTNLPNLFCVCRLFSGLITIKDSRDIEARLNEVEKLLKNIINMPWKVGS